MITLTRGRIRLDLAPEIGGSIARLTIDGQDILRPAKGPVTDPLDAACFPLVPFSNRIAFGKFSFEAREVRLPNDPPDPVHALHGHGWRQTWSLVASTREMVRLRLEHEAGDWPWAYTADEEFTLLDNGVRIALEVTNRDEQTMPVIIGFHPFFPKTPVTEISAIVDGVWMTDATRIPTVSQPKSIFDQAKVPEIVHADHCYAGWRGAMTVSQPDRDLELSLRASEELGFLHLFVPDGEAYFCAEPTSAMPNAINRDEPATTTGLRTLRHAEKLSAWVEIRATIRG